MATYFLHTSNDIAPGYEGRASLEVNVAQKTSTLRIAQVTMKDSRQYQCNVQVPNDDEGKTVALTSVLVLGEEKSDCERSPILPTFTIFFALIQTV